MGHIRMVVYKETKGMKREYGSKRLGLWMAEQIKHLRSRWHRACASKSSRAV